MGKNGKCYVGVDLGGTNIQAGVLDPNHKLRSRVKSKTKASEGSVVVVKRVAEAVREAIKQAQMTPD
jgi:glucokinase